MFRLTFVSAKASSKCLWWLLKVPCNNFCIHANNISQQNQCPINCHYSSSRLYAAMTSRITVLHLLSGLQLWQGGLHVNKCWLAVVRVSTEWHSPRTAPSQRGQSWEETGAHCRGDLEMCVRCDEVSLVFLEQDVQKASSEFKQTLYLLKIPHKMLWTGLCKG